MEVYQNLRQGNLVDMVFKRIRQDIVSRKVMPGDRFPHQGELALQFGVSRTVIREAQTKLASLGLIENRQGSGTYVCSPRADEIIAPMISLMELDVDSTAELMEARFHVEGAIARLAAGRADREGIERLGTFIDGMVFSADPSRLENFIDADFGFHLELANISGNRVLSRIVETIREMTYRFLQAFCLSPGAMDRAVAFHQSIAEAVEARDPDLAEERMHLHMLDILKNVDLYFQTLIKQPTGSLINSSAYRSSIKGLGLTPDRS